ncbi:MAG: hypothetical protein COU09_01155 [Candidatus Harrisonbacteria bacterium CG10_big_fil_rev_8_21_14_0_10_44_23]|uniref:TraB family protein n=1 Tax=Candidatus Harrisonbacteria bacterium CG10_big_fil_rev_8_21_14_0_10_44_23 TaxID=1974585 RepID=A0A2H0UQH3_9BACT|nr:MAG: hypothetical protein COU09_01155 [Candidatus Harrisonbacteria bacterium CG10_big_fil_rev_8_21_14_0_10_44_23]
MSVFEKSQYNPVLRLGPNSVGQVLYFFGAVHTNKYTDIQFKNLRKFWDKFLSVTKNEKTVFIEGVLHELPPDYKEAIKVYGETGAIGWLAREAGIEIVHAEPSEDLQRESLCGLFDSKVVAYSIIIQNLGVWFRHESQTDFEEALNRVLKREAKFSDIYGFTTDKSWFSSQHEKLFPHQTLEDKQFLDSISDPRNNNTVVNEIVACRSKFRDKHILSLIKKVFQSGKSIFIVYGKGHLATLESSIQKLVTDIS